MTELPKEPAPLLPELEALIAEATAEEGPDNRTRERLYNRLAGTLALPLLPPPGAGEAALSSKATASLLGGKAGAIVASLSVGALLVGTAGWVVYQNATGAGVHGGEAPVPSLSAGRGTEPEPAPEGRPVADTEDAGVSKEIVRDEPLSGPEENSVSEAPKPHPPGPPSAVPPSPAVERALIESARAALQKGSPDDALRLLKRYRRQFAGGIFREEGDALRIMALKRAGNRSAAARQAERFVSRYPQSIFADAVRDALTEEEGAHAE